MTLEEIAAQIEADPVEIRALDVSEAMGKPAGTVVFKYRLPDVPALFQRNEDAEEIRKRNPLLPRSLCSTLALMALAHVEPMPAKQPVGALYQAFVKNRKLWTRLESGFMTIFPELYGVRDLTAEAKNGSGEETEESSEPSPSA